MAKTFKVFIIDDSALMRQLLGAFINEDPRLTLIGISSNPILAKPKIAKLKPDVILLDIYMPEKNGIEYLRELMSEKPIPVVVCSEGGEKGSDIYNEAIASGAIDVIEKPKQGLQNFLYEEKDVINSALFLAAQKKVKKMSFLSAHPTEETKTVDCVLAKTKEKTQTCTQKVIAIGASTGGTEAIATLLKSLNGFYPPIVIVQHMPKAYIHAFSKRLNELTNLSVDIAKNGEPLLNNHVYISPGDVHIVLRKAKDKYVITYLEGPLVNRHKPSVDVLFRSVANSIGHNAVGILLTGMGVDGAQGLLELKQAGAKTFAESKKSCMVYGMPKAAKELDAVTSMVPIENMAFNLSSALTTD